MFDRLDSVCNDGFIIIRYGLSTADDIFMELDSSKSSIDLEQVPRVSNVDSSSEEKQADKEANPYAEENLLEIIRELMDSNKRLYAKSVLTPKEAQVYANLASFGEYHRTPSLISYVNRQLEYKMSIEGKRVEQMIHPYKRGEENSQRKSLKDKIIDLG
ncbi:MAG TPA: hypothetical protein VEP90_24130 [Methylomirabilota bacterium]|nr:hypothetical protein [Methylomirabilota bacterium]